MLCETMESMPVSPTFLRIRVIAFSLIAFLSFLWAIFYTLDMYWLFDGMKAPERILISLMLLNSSATCIMLLVLITREFRPWLDAARILLLFTTHICSAVGYSLWYPSYVCPAAKSADMCRMFNLYILVINWVDIVLLLIYAGGLATLVFVRRRAMQREAQQGIQEKFVIDAPDATEIGRGDLLHTTYSPPTLTPSSRHAHSRSSASSFFPYPQTATPQSMSPPQSRHSSIQSSRHNHMQSSHHHSIQSSLHYSAESSRPHSTEGSRHNSTPSSRSHSRSRTNSRTLTMSPIVEEPRLPEPAVGKPDLSPRSSARLSRPRHFM
ncbi:hypothetical protein K523DRAFT_260032 [Schizophyllum commune Tattone D]|nr:hypothetical protein K525DRAFT_235689 [Schizophyllum commune Loenen D]KAI5835676.1 hypothetical protein K523DRAFT_260032 [Schizophyllum commune Tattone D]